MGKAEIITDSNYQGYHNKNYEDTRRRIEKSKLYQDLSTICIIPSPNGMLPVKFVQQFTCLMTPMNQKFYRMFVSGHEVGAAYTEAIKKILENAELSKYRFLLTIEWDNIIYQPDALLKLYEDMDEYDIASGLYFTKGYGGMPMAYGKPGDQPINFIPFCPPDNTIVPVNGVGMGFCLFKLDIFKDSRFEQPLFRTVQEFIAGVGARAYTQDLFWCEQARKLGYKLCVDSRVKIGHLDIESGDVW